MQNIYLEIITPIISNTVNYFINIDIIEIFDGFICIYMYFIIMILNCISHILF